MTREEFKSKLAEMYSHGITATEWSVMADRLWQVIQELQSEVAIEVAVRDLHATTEKVIERAAGKLDPLFEAEQAALTAVRQYMRLVTPVLMGQEVTVLPSEILACLTRLRKADVGLERAEKEARLHIRPRFHADGDIDEEVQCPK